MDIKTTTNLRRRGRPVMPKRNINLVSIVKIYVNDNSDYILTHTRIDPRKLFSTYKFKLAKRQDDETASDQLTANTDLLLMKVLDEFEAPHTPEGKTLVYDRMRTVVLQQRLECKGKCMSDVKRYVGEQRVKHRKEYYQKKRDYLQEKIECEVCRRMITRGSINTHRQSLRHNRS